MGTVAEQFLNGMYSNYVMLAVPLFILAAELMNNGSLSERLLRWCDAVVGRFRGGLAQVNILQSIIFAGMSGSAIADAAGTGKMMQYMMTKDGKYTAELCGGPHGGLGGDRSDHSAFHPHDPLRPRVRCLDRLPVSWRRHSRPADGHRPDGHHCRHGAPQEFPGRKGRAAARSAAHHLGEPSGTADAGRADGRGSTAA